MEMPVSLKFAHDIREYKCSNSTQGIRETVSLSLLLLSTIPYLDIPVKAIFL